MHECFQPVEGEFQFAQYGNSNVLDEIQELLEASVKASCEGLMVKMLDTAESGYEPSKRSRNWLKVGFLRYAPGLALAHFYIGQKRLPRWCW